MPVPLLVYGGTFDPVHGGHVAVAQAVAALFPTAEVRLVPGGDPPHRAPPRVPGPLRAQMLRLAFADAPRFVVDERELHRAGPSYTVDTLRELRAEIGAERPLLLVLGRDAANGLAGWHEPAALPALCHLLVVARPGAQDEADEAGAVRLGWRHVDDPAVLAATPAGRVARLARSVSAASSTGLRAQLRAGVATDGELPPAVAAFIAAHGLYR